MTGNSELLNIAVFPPDSVAKSVANLSRSCGGLFTVDNLTRFAHLTLFMARFPTGVRSEVVARITRTVARTPAFQVKHAGYRLTGGNYYEVSYDISDSLQQMQCELSAALSPLRFRPLNPIHEQYFSLTTARQRQQVELTGYDLDGIDYRPHITLTRYQTVANPLLVSDEDLSFIATNATLSIADDFGAAARVLKTSRTA